MCDSTIAMSNTKNKSKMLLSLLCVVIANITDSAGGASPAATAGDNDNPPAAGKRGITVTTLGGTVTELDVYPDDITLAQFQVKLAEKLPVIIADYDLVYDTKPLTNDRQLRELLQKDNPQITLVASLVKVLQREFEAWHREFREWLTGVRAFLLDINGGAAPKTAFIQEKIGWISEKLEPLFDNQLNLRDATLLKYNRGDGIGLEWPAGQGRIRLSIATPDTDTPLWHSILEYLPGPDESQVEYFFRFTDKHLDLPGGSKVALNLLRAQPKIPTSIFTQLESEYKSVNNNAALFPSEA